MRFLKKYWSQIALIVLFIFLVKQCETKPHTKTTIKTVYQKVTDTFTEVETDTFIKEVYTEKTKTIKGKDSIIYVKNPTKTSTKANQYTTTLNSNNATANLQITTTGKLLDVYGTINYKKQITTITKTKHLNNSGLFLYGETSVVPTFKRAEIGLDYQFKNKFIVGSSVSVNGITKKPNINVKFGVKIY